MSREVTGCTLKDSPAVAFSYFASRDVVVCGENDSKKWPLDLHLMRVVKVV